MWFKQIQLFKLTEKVNSQAPLLAKKLAPLSFTRCAPSMAYSMGFISPLEEDGPLVRGINGCLMICLQIEEKILPMTVVNQAVKDKIKHIELNEARKVRQKEKLNLKDEVTFTLLPQAFTKFTKVYAYIDTNKQWLILDTMSEQKTQHFISMFKKACGDGIASFDIVTPAKVLTQWLSKRNFPKEFNIEKSCVLRDIQQQTRMIRCQQQDLFAASIQSLLNDGCEVIQLAMSWQDRLEFVITDTFKIRGIRLAQDNIIEIKEEMESEQQKFDADLYMMSELYAGLCDDLLAVFAKKDTSAP